VVTVVVVVVVVEGCGPYAVTGVRVIIVRGDGGEAQASCSVSGSSTDRLATVAAAAAAADDDDDDKIDNNRTKPVELFG